MIRGFVVWVPRHFLMPHVLVFLHWLPRPASMVHGLQNLGRLPPAVTQLVLPGRQLAEALSTANDITVSASRIAECGSLLSPWVGILS